MGKKVRLFVTDIETTFTQGEFSPERIISLDAADTNLDVRCVTANLSFEVVNLQLCRVFLVLGSYSHREPKHFYFYQSSVRNLP